MHLFKLYLRFVIVYIKSICEYRAALLIDIVVQFAIFGSSFAVIWVIAQRFQTVGGWNYYELIFLYNLNMLSYGIAGFVFWEPMRELNYAVRKGTFDSMLIYPLNPLIHLCFRNIAHQNIGNVILGGIVFAVCFQHLPILWTIPKMVWFILTIISGSLIQFCLMVLVGACNFWLKQARGVFNLTFFGLKNFLDYPIKIYDSGIQFLLTFIVPYAFVNFYPAQYFLDKSGDFLFHPLLQFTAPFIAILFLIVTLRVWKIGLYRYESAGS